MRFFYVISQVRGLSRVRFILVVTSAVSRGLPFWDSVFTPSLWLLINRPYRSTVALIPNVLLFDSMILIIKNPKGQILPVELIPGS